MASFLNNKDTIKDTELSLLWMWREKGINVVMLG